MGSDTAEKICTSNCNRHRGSWQKHYKLQEKQIMMKKL